MTELQLFFGLALVVVVVYLLIMGAINYYFKTKADFVDHLNRRINSRMKGSENGQE